MLMATGLGQGQAAFTIAVIGPGGHVVIIGIGDIGNNISEL